MRGELYSILALAMRYVFCGLALVIVFRAWRITVVDNRRARILTALMPDVANIGEFIAQSGPSGVRRVRYPIPREGTLGASGGADVSIRHPDVRRKHAFFELREKGLLIRPLRGGTIASESGAAARLLILRDGECVMLGKLKLMLVLFDAAGKPSAPPAEPAERTDAPLDEFFDGEDLWREESARVKKTRKR